MEPESETRGRPAPMEAGGFYNDHAELQAGGGAHGLPLLARAFEDIPLEGAPLVIADYGSAQGRNSMGPMGAALVQIRRRMGVEAPVSIVHVDQPENDFADLFTFLRDDPASYLSRDGNVFPAAVGRSFYGPVLAPGSVTFGWSAFALHWLSAPPMTAAGHLWPRMAEPEVRARFAAQSAADWRAFLTHRAQELRPGGCLVTVQPTLRPEDPATFPLMMTWAKAELDAMEADGTLRPEEGARMTLLVYERGPDDIRAPFADSSFMGLTLKDEELRDLPDPFWGPYLADGNVEALADAYVGFFRAPFMPSLLAALDANRDATFRAAFARRLEAGLKARIIEAPAPLLSPLAVHVALMEKV